MDSPLIAAGAGSWFAAGSAALSNRVYPDSEAREAPLRLDRHVAQLVEFDSAAWNGVATRFSPRLSPQSDDAAVGESCDSEPGSSPSLCVHSLRIHGLDARFDDDVLPNGAAVVRALTDNDIAKRVFGAEVLARTRYGARYRPPGDLPEQRTSADASHPDQTLAALLELGVPLSTEIRVDGTPGLTLADVLADTVANFNPHEVELEWTAVALALALPPARAWRNRYDQTFTFDDLTDRLVSKQFEHLSCGGTHVLYAMVALAAAHARTEILSPDAEANLHRRIDGFLDCVRANQSKDGSWNLDWFRDGRIAATRKSRLRPTLIDKLLITGHLGECLLLLPSSMRVDDSILRKAGDWLAERLPPYLRVAPLNKEYCPMTHAAVVLGALSGRA